VTSNLNRLNNMKTKQKVKKLAKELGCNLDPDTYEITAPNGYRFKATETHAVVFEPWIEGFIAGKRNRPANTQEIEQAWQGALSDLEFGIEPCPSDCECRDEKA
jgi:hypothetical protein